VLFVANEDDGRLDELIDNVASIALKPLETFKLILSTDNGPIAAVRIMDFKLTNADLMELQVTLGIHTKKNVLSEWLDSAKGVEGQFFEELTAVLPNPKHPWLVEKLLNPTIKVQGVAAFKTLDILGSLLHREDLIQDEKDGEMLKLVTTTQGLKAVDQLRMINEMHDKKLLKKPLSKNKHLIPFLQEFPSVTEVYKPYLAILDDETLNPREKVQAVENLKIELERQRKRIISGEATNEDVQNPTYAGLLYYTFPPATTLGREQYRALLETRVDRQKDVPQEWEVLQNKLLKFSIGAYALKEGERVDTTAWNAIARAVEEGNRTDAEGFTTKQIANLGKQLLEALTDPKKFNKNRNLLLSQIYSLHRFINGVKLSTNLSDRDNLYQLKEYASDRMRDTIDVMFQEFAKADPVGYERAAATLTSVEIDEKAKTGIVKNLLSVLRAPTLNDEKTNERLKAVLEKYDIHFEGDILGRSLEQIGELDPNDPKVDEEAEKILKDWFTSLLLKAHQERSNTNLAVEASHRLLGEDRAKMGGEMKKFEFKQNAEGGQIRILRLEVSKRRAHAVAGLNMGVCVAPDEQLWNKIDFANVILWDENNIARGGFHVETIESEGRIYLSLPGINPASSILGVVNPEELFDELIAYAKEMAKAIGAEGILIPRTGEIHSNRAEIQSVLTKKRYKKFSLTEPHRFSYKPHGYVWKDAYLIEV
jgi:hypothetical protein